MRNSGMTSYRYRPPQELHLLSILAQTASRQASGCLQVTDGVQTWRLFLEQGKLAYATSSAEPFGRLDRYLRRLSNDVPTVASPVRVQVRLLFESPIADPKHPAKDYEAICWLVEQKYLQASQAAELIGMLARDVLETLLPVQSGNYDLIDRDLLSGWPRFCALDLRSLVESCRVKQPRRAVNAPPPPPPAVRNPVQSWRPSPPPATAFPPAQPSSARPSLSTPPSNQPGIPRNVPAQTLSRTTYTIACIDDSPTVLSAIESFLDDQAFKVIRIENPVSALMKIIRHKPDLILLDVTMPNLDGYELCSLLRRHPAFKQTPIIMVTGNRGFIDRAKAKLVGASGYLTKPFAQPDLLKVIFKHLT
ncbi:MAG: response regulator [Cyanobacteria bacterium P01_C01_bin.73]